MNVSLEKWSQYLSEVASATSSSHLWICEVQRSDGNRCMEVLSNDEYEHFYDRSPRNCQRRKLSFREMISISEQLIPNKNQYLTNGELFINSHDMSDTDPKKPVVTLLSKAKSDTKNFEKIAHNLDKIFQRSLQNRLKEKETSICGLIKYYIWSLFFDKSSYIQEIKKTTTSFNEYYKMIKEAIQDRIIMNMAAFEEEIGIDKAEQTDCSDDATRNLFHTPAQVKKIWLTKYAPDKYPKEVSCQANTFRTRVLALLSVWDAIEKFVVS